VTLDDALADVRDAFLQIEFSIKLLGYCEHGNIDSSEFDTHEVVLLEHGTLGFPSGSFSTQSEIIRAASVAVSLALAGSALSLDKAWDIAGIPPDPRSEDRRVKLRTLVYMVRCAFAHGVADPKWEVRRDYCRILEIDLANGPLRLDLRELHGRNFDFDQLGGHAGWFDIHEESVAELAELNAAASE